MRKRIHTQNFQRIKVFTTKDCPYAVLQMSGDNYQATSTISTNDIASLISALTEAMGVIEIQNIERLPLKPKGGK